MFNRVLNKNRKRTKINEVRLKTKGANRGITLIALVVTVIVLLILAGISIQMLSGENSILRQASKAKEQTEIASEKEQIQLAVTSMEFENETNLIKRKEKLKNNFDNEDVEIYIHGNEYLINFRKSKNTYIVDNSGRISLDDSNIIKNKITDEHPGELESTGTNEFKINSIEDLVAFSNNVNSGNSYSGKTIKLGKTLDFKSELSYASLTKKYVYDDVNGIYIENDSSNKTLMELMSQGEGFIPIGVNSTSGFGGNFDGDNLKIENIYINRNGIAGFFGNITVRDCTIKNLTLSGNIISINDSAAGFIVDGSQGLNISNCVCEVNVVGNGTVGGFVGWGENGSSIKNVTLAHDALVINKHVFKDGTNDYGTNDYGTGGIVGHSNGVTIQDSSVYGTIEGECAAGISARGTTIVNKCKIYGKINGSKYAAGIVARPVVRKTEIYNCVIDSKAEIISQKYAGGIYGIVSNYGDTHILNSCVFGKIIAPVVAGISVQGGHSWQNQNLASIKNSYFAGILEGENLSGIQSYIVSTNAITFDNCYYLNSIPSAIYNVDDSNLLGIKSITSDEMKKRERQNEDEKTMIESFNDFANEYNLNEDNKIKLVNWRFDNDSGYPTLNF